MQDWNYVRWEKLGQNTSWEGDWRNWKAKSWNGEQASGPKRYQEAQQDSNILVGNLAATITPGYVGEAVWKTIGETALIVSIKVMRAAYKCSQVEVVELPPKVADKFVSAPSIRVGLINGYRIWQTRSSRTSGAMSSIRFCQNARQKTELIYASGAESLGTNRKTVYNRKLRKERS